MKSVGRMTAVTLLSLLAFAAGCGTTVRPGERGVKYLSLAGGPGLQHEVKPEGFYFQWPWNDIIKYDVTLQNTEEPLEILTADALHVTTTVSVTYRADPNDIYRLQTDVGPGYYQEVIRPAFLTLARSEFARHEHNNLAKDGPEIERNVLSQLREAVSGKPLMVDRVAIVHIQFDAGVSRAISEKLAAEQRLAQKTFDLKIAEQDAEIARAAARGRGDAIRLQAEGEAQALRIRAEGEAKAVVLAGEAQARAQSDIAKTLTPGYLRYKAFDSDATRYYFVPTGKDGMPIIVGADGGSAGSREATRKGRSLSNIRTP